MARHIALATVLAILGGSQAFAGPPEPPCWLVRFYVTVYGEKVATYWALAHGYTRADLEVTKVRCGLASHRE